jgi:ATP-dependent protease ClpP protease subunit
MRIRTKFERFEGETPKLATADGKVMGFSVSARADETIINVKGVIGDEWDGLTATTLVPKIQAIDTPIVLRLNSPGGFVTDALDIYDSLVEHQHNVRADIVAEAWSAGTIITSAADEVRIRGAAIYGIHCAHSGLIIVGNSREMRAQVPEVVAYTEYLDKLDLQIADIIASRSGLDRSDVLELMIGEEGCDGTQWIGEEAVKAGFVDSLMLNNSSSAQKTANAKPDPTWGARMRRNLRIARLRAA